MEFDFVSILYAFYNERTPWELVAVCLGLAYLALAMRESLWCWPAAFVSTVIYTWLFWQVALLMDSMLNVYYMGMAVFGWWSWVRVNKSDDSLPEAADTPPEPIQKIVSWRWQNHFIAIAAVVTLSVISAALLRRYTEAAWPFWDSFTTWGSVLTTYMVAKKVLENWLYWIVIDAVAMVLYIERGLYPTALLFAVYLVMVVYGYFAWRRRYMGQSMPVAEPAAIS